MPDMHLDTSEATELTELLQLLADWITSGHDTLNTSLTLRLPKPHPSRSELIPAAFGSVRSAASGTRQDERPC
jgi:hypothetical protein